MVYASVVICTMDKPQRVLDCLKKQTFKNFEVIIASEEGIVKAMNNALQTARGEIFIRIDDDVDLPERWLESLLKPFKRPTVGGVTGPTWVPKDRRHLRDSIRIAEDPNWFLRWMFDGKPFARGAIYKCGSVSYGSNYEEAQNWLTKVQIECDHLEGTNWAMRTDLIREVGGFDPAFDGVCEWFDTDVEQKIKKLGYRLIYNPEAFLYHLLEKGNHFDQRNEMCGRIENWLRFHKRHSKFHYKKLLWLIMLMGYAVCPKPR